MRRTPVTLALLAVGLLSGCLTRQVWRAPPDGAEVIDAAIDADGRLYVLLDRGGAGRRPAVYACALTAPVGVPVIPPTLTETDLAPVIVDELPRLPDALRATGPLSPPPAEGEPGYQTLGDRGHARVGGPFLLRRRGWSDDLRVELLDPSDERVLHVARVRRFPRGRAWRYAVTPLTVVTDAVVSLALIPVVAVTSYAMYAGGYVTSGRPGRPLSLFFPSW